ncbi:hypothetical protein AGMMS49965_13250 [Bacteroidia bacterium]|nr:hypothetical protein AGMMS49965_13250 [Bacteroidia bacterium]
MTVADAIRQVKIRMQELTPFGEWLAKTNPAAGGDPIPVTNGLLVLRPTRDEKPIESYIRECLPDAFKIIVDSVPEHLVPISSMEPTLTPDYTGAKTGTIKIPFFNPFYKLKFLQLSDWERPVTEAITMDSPEYKLQFNEWTRGGISRPVVAIERSLSGTDFSTTIKLHYFSTNEWTHELKTGTRLLYINGLTQPTELNANIDLDENLEIPFYYITASLVYSIYGQTQFADSMMETAKAMIQGTIKQ